MAEVTYKFLSVADPNDAFSDEGNVTDTNEDNFAVDNVGKNSVGPYLIGDANNCPGTNLGSITKVEALFKVGTDTGRETSMVPLMSVLFGGTTASGEYSGDFASDGNPANYTIDITNISGSPSSWGWTDIQNLDLRARGDNNATNNNINFRIYTFKVRVTYIIPVSDDKGQKAMMGINF
jgi:hypothetical protein